MSKAKYYKAGQAAMEYKGDLSRMPDAFIDEITCLVFMRAHAENIAHVPERLITRDMVRWWFATHAETAYGPRRMRFQPSAALEKLLAEECENFRKCDAGIYLDMHETWQDKFVVSRLLRFNPDLAKSLPEQADLWGGIRVALEDMPSFENVRKILTYANKHQLRTLGVLKPMLIGFMPEGSLDEWDLLCVAQSARPMEMLRHLPGHLYTRTLFSSLLRKAQGGEGPFLTPAHSQWVQQEEAMLGYLDSLTDLAKGPVQSVSEWLDERLAEGASFDTFPRELVTAFHDRLIQANRAAVVDMAKRTLISALGDDHGEPYSRRLLDYYRVSVQTLREMSVNQANGHESKTHDSNQLNSNRLLLALLIQDHGLDNCAPHIKGRSDWMEMEKLFSRKELMQYPQARRALLEDDLAL